MTTEQTKFSHDSLQDAQTIGNYLRAVADGLAAGKLSLASSDDELVLEPNGLLRLRIRAQRAQHRNRLALRISWRERSSVPEGKAAVLEIGAAQPADKS